MVATIGARLGKASKTKAYRAQACYRAMEAQGDARPLCWPGATVRATFFHAKKARRDRDNALASLKAAFDGLADAGVVVNDSALTHLPVVFAINKARPRVVLELWRSEA